MSVGGASSEAQGIRHQTRSTLRIRDHFRLGLLTSALSTHVVAAQNLKPPLPLSPVPLLDDHELHAALRTAADTARLLRFAVPIALDSLRLAGPGRHPVRLSLPQLAGPDTAWAATLVDGQWVRGICRPIRRHCRGNEVLQLMLEPTPSAGANEVRLVLRHARLKPPPRAVVMHDEMRRWLEERAIGIPSTGPLLYGPATLQMVPPDRDPCLTLTPTSSGWRVTAWHAPPVGAHG